MEVWSFQRMSMALGFSANSGLSAKGLPRWSTAIGEDPVVSTPIPLIWLGEIPDAVTTPLMVASNPSRWSLGCCLNWLLRGSQYLPAFHLGYQETLDAMVSPLEASTNM